VSLCNTSSEACTLDDGFRVWCWENMGFRLAYLSCPYATRPAIPVCWMMGLGFSVEKLLGLGWHMCRVLMQRVQRFLYVG